MSQKLILIIAIVALAATGVMGDVKDDDYYMTKDDFINGIIDRHLKKKMEPNEEQYRQDLGSNLFEDLIRKYPKRSFFVNVYAPVMGFDNHAMRSFDMFDRLHKRNDMRFNVFIGTVEKRDYMDIQAHLTEQKIEYAKNMCFFQDCSNALTLKNFIEQHHGCIHGMQILNRNVDQHVFENMSDHVMIKYVPYTERYNLYAWVTNDSCLSGSLSGFLI